MVSPSLSSKVNHPKPASLTSTASFPSKLSQSTALWDERPLLRSKEQRQLEAPIFVIREELRHLPCEDRGLNEAHEPLYANDV